MNINSFLELFFGGIEENLFVIFITKILHYF